MFNYLVTITGNIVSYYDQVEVARTPALLDAIRAGSTVLLVTDAGMPIISDPGLSLVAAAAERDIELSPQFDEGSAMLHRDGKAKSYASALPPLPKVALAEVALAQMRINSDVKNLPEGALPHLSSRAAMLDALTPGDYAVVRNRAKLLGELGNGAELKKMLEAEVAVKPHARKQIGFHSLQSPLN